ncbi:MAG: SpoIID/LytB domain-containing protein [Bdellovibrionales bacterium]|nr:SpoIID/LytB domain-containing protein [Bdellovibrionales bacterium]
MLKRSLILSIALLGMTDWSTTASAGARMAARLGHPVAPRIRVRLEAKKESFDLSGFQLKITDHRGRSVAGQSAVSKSTIRVHCSGDQLKVQSLDPGKTGIALLPEKIQIESATGVVRLENVPHRDRLVIYHAKGLSRGCEVVNEMDLEEYLEGLVNAEFSAKWSSEAVMAQIVAARSYALFQIHAAKANPAKHFDIESTVKDQVYGGMLKEDAEATRLVSATRGMVLSASRFSSKAMKAFYHSTCGGLTELPEKVWGSSEPGFHSRVRCEHCKSSPRFSWSLSVSLSDLQKRILDAMKKEGLPRDWEKVISSAEEFSKSARLENVAVSGANHPAQNHRLDDLILTWRWKGGRKIVPLSAHTFRMWMGPDQIRSTAFSMTAKPNGYFFKGLGNGHGVGMCQWGAKVMAEKGKKMSEILSLYYPDATLRKFW